jgi:regulator of replication initiation timing
MSKSDAVLQERSKLLEIFAQVEPAKAQLVEGLIEDAAFLRAETQELRDLIGRTGMVRVHPEHPEIQKSTEAAKQYLKNVNSYAVVIKTLNGILQKNVIEEEDAFDAFLEEMHDSD